MAARKPKIVTTTQAVFWSDGFSGPWVQITEGHGVVSMLFGNEL